MKVRTFDLRRFSDGGSSSPFSNGLRPEEELNHEAQYLSVATNAYLMESGCFNAEKFTRTFNLDEDAQIFSAYKGIFVLTKDELLSYSRSMYVDTWDSYGATTTFTASSVTGLSVGGSVIIQNVMISSGNDINGKQTITGIVGNQVTVNFDSTGSTYVAGNIPVFSLLTGLTLGGFWSIADFGDYILFTNGEVNLIRNPTTGIFTTDGGTVFPLAKSICAHRGRVILGGPKNYPKLGEFFSNWVAWSDINNLEFVGATELDQARQNLSGYMPIPWEGNVLKVEPLNDKVIVYGDNGITALKLISTELAASTYGQEDVHDVGVKWQGSMTTNGKKDGKQIHYFVDSTGWLYELGNDLNPKRLGYKEFLG
jgi:hypothetical protein